MVRVSIFSAATMLMGYAILLCILTRSSGEIKQLTLDGRWFITDKQSSINIAAHVPGGIYSDLMNAYIIDDIFFDSNDVKYRWISNGTWIYYRDFHISKEFLDNDDINIVFNGLDTVSSIKINKVLIGVTENMFVRYVFDIKKHLNTGLNKIEIRFESPIRQAALRYTEEAEKRGGQGVPPTCVPLIYNGECHANHLRKQQASFAWDWGPAFPSVGIWKSIHIEAFNGAVIRDVVVNTKIRAEKRTPIHKDGIPYKSSYWDITTTVYFETNSVKDVHGTLSIILHLTNNSYMETNYENIILTENASVVEKIFSVSETNEIQKWWPNGYGEQKLYKLEVKFNSSNEISNKIINIGFRTVELVQEPIDDDDSHGLTFYFKINDIPMFMKGSNWIPANILPEWGGDANEQSIETVERLLKSVKDANMNMLRVWGGGVYESDYFYDLADKLGIMIWQDFMFACSMYPASEEFLDNVYTEVVQQVKRLQHHPSVVVWAGNNENEAALRQNWYNTIIGFKQFKKDYVALYVDTIKEALFSIDRNIPYVVSSPSNGIKSEKEGYIALNPYNLKYGDIHYYNYFLDSWNENIYPTPRFSSEYGFQSLPSLRTFQTATSSNITWKNEFMSHRQHHPAGYEEIKIQIKKRLPNIAETNDTRELEQWIYYSQISQAMGIKIQTEKYRRMRSFVKSNGEGLTMGALYWQLNDVWQAPSWSSIDFKGRWKMLHYFAKNFFAPIIVSPSLSPSSNLSVYIISDALHTISNTILEISIYQWNNFTPLHVESLLVTVDASKSVLVYEQWLDNLLGMYNCNISTCFLYFSLEQNSQVKYETNEIKSNFNLKNSNDQQAQLSPDNFLFPIPLKDVIGSAIPVMAVRVLSAVKEKCMYELEITTTEISPFVWIDAGNVTGRFSENGFLQIEPKKYVRFYADTFVDIKLLESSLSVKSLFSK